MRGGGATREVHEDISGAAELKKDPRFGEEARALEDGADVRAAGEFIDEVPHGIVPVHVVTP